MLPGYPKIWTLGDPRIENIFSKGEVEITEKIDGSQFAFGLIEGELKFRSKGAEIRSEQPNKMFLCAVKQVEKNKEVLPPNYIFYGEYLRQCKHNILEYKNVPKGHLAIFAILTDKGKFVNTYQEVKFLVEPLQFDVVPLLFKGKVSSKGVLDDFLKKESYLKGPQIEGVVVKNYSLDMFVGSQYLPIMCGKYVSEKFKEQHKSEWGKNHTSRGKFEVYKDSFRTEARWNKAIQHLRDKDMLTSTPKDIGGLIKEIYKDIEEEEKENIKEFLWKEFSDEVLRRAVQGFPEFYKEKLLKDVVFN